MSRLGKPRPSHRKIQHQRAVIRAGKGLVLRNGAGEQALRRDEGVIDVVGAIEMPVQIKGRHALASLLLPLRLMPGGNETGLLHHPHHRRMRALAVLGIPSAIAVEVADDDAALVDLLAVKDGEAIIVDYKYSAKDADSLVRAYRKQLSLYKYAVESALGLKVKAAYLVSLAEAKALAVSV